MRQQQRGRIAAGRYRRAPSLTRSAPATQAPDDVSRPVLKIAGVVGSVASDDGSVARVRLQTPVGETDLEIDRGDLAALLAAVALAQQGCAEKAVSDRRVQFAHPAQALALDALTDPDTLLLTVTLDAGQRMSFCVERSMFDACRLPSGA